MLSRSAPLFSRDVDNAAPTNHTMTTLLIVLMILVAVALFLVGGLLLLRARRRASKQQDPPAYDDEKRLSISSISTHRRIMARPSEPIHVCQEKRSLVNDSQSPPPSPLPEIRITLPEEVDASGKRQSGRVVVVRIGDTGIGLEPADHLPAYQHTESERFQSLDLDRIGGLVEKARNKPNKEYQ